MDNYKGLPAEFCPPGRAARRIADLASLAARREYFDRIPAQWQGMIAHLARLLIAGNIVDLPRREARVRAMEEVPGEWRNDVAAHVRRLWQRPVE